MRKPGPHSSMHPGCLSVTTPNPYGCVCVCLCGCAHVCVSQMDLCKRLRALLGCRAKWHVTPPALHKNMHKRSTGAKTSGCWWKHRFLTIKVIPIHPEGTMNVWAKCRSNLSNSCRSISPKKHKFQPHGGTRRTVSRMHPLGTMIVRYFIIN